LPALSKQDFKRSAVASLDESIRKAREQADQDAVQHLDEMKRRMEGL
jgi:hypothetical protein